MDPLEKALSQIKQINREKREARKFVSTGIPDLDDALKGGFPRGHLTEIWGEAACGKSRMVGITLLHNSKRQITCALIDIDGDYESVFPIPDMEKAVEETGQVVYVKPRTGAETIESALALAETCDLVVVDSLGGFCGDGFGEDLLEPLGAAAQRTGCCILVTVPARYSIRKRAMGPLSQYRVRYYAGTLIKMERISIIRRQGVRVGIEVEFQIEKCKHTDPAQNVVRYAMRDDS